MKKLVILLVGGILVLSCSSCARETKQEATKEGDNIVITRGDNYVEFKKIKDVDEKYRVFGITTLTKGNNFVNHITASIPMLPLDRARKLWKRDDCEKQAYQEATEMPIIILDSGIEKKFNSYMRKRNNYEHFSLQLTGVLLQSQKHLFNGEPVEPSGSFSINRCLLLEDVAIVEWNNN